jgi:translocation and assembly module TamB
MATEPPAEVHVVPRGRLRARAAAKWAGIVLLSFFVLIGLLFAWLSSDYGRRFVVKQINGLEMATGLNIHVGRIEGSLFGQLTLHDLTLSDPKGRFFAAPEAKMDWRPLAYFSSHVDIRAIDIPSARLWRLPALRPGDPNAPLLPDINLDIGRLKVDRLVIDPAVTGYRHLLSLDGKAKIANRRAQLALNAVAIAGPGLPGGDKLVLRLDAVPEQNRLDMGVRLSAPAGGFVAGLTGLAQPLEASLNGRGSWADWNGRAIALLGGKAFANLGVNAKNGTFTMVGPANPGLMMAEGTAKRLLQPMVQVSLVTSLSQRRADTRLRLSSQAIAVGAEGLVDLGRSEFSNLKLAVRLPHPEAVLPNLRRATSGSRRCSTGRSGRRSSPTTFAPTQSASTARRWRASPRAAGPL